MSPLSTRRDKNIMKMKYNHWNALLEKYKDLVAVFPLKFDKLQNTTMNNTTCLAR
jgi:hypothetical protein